MRVTWIQPEDLVGHELRQAREEGKDVDAVEERWLAAGGRPAPGRGASQEVSPPELVRLADDCSTSSTSCRGPCRRTSRTRW